MLIALLFWTAVAFVFALLITAPLTGLARALGGRLWSLLASGVLVAVGTALPSAVAVLWYARSADYRWAIRGPGVFAHLGGGPAMLALGTVTLVWTLTCWALALLLAGEAVRSGDQP